MIKNRYERYRWNTQYGPIVGYVDNLHLFNVLMAKASYNGPRYKRMLRGD